MKKAGLVLAALAFVFCSTPANAQVKAKATAHSVALSWVAPVPPPVVTCPSGTPAGTTCYQCPTGTAANVYCTYTISGYNVYRGTATGAETLLTTSSVTGTTYTDTAVSPGSAYFYEVTALNGTTESAKSNEVSVTIPANQVIVSPNAPTGLSGTVQ